MFQSLRTVEMNGDLPLKADRRCLSSRMLAETPLLGYVSASTGLDDNAGTITG